MALGTRLAGLVAGIMLIVGGLAGQAAAESAVPAYPGDFPDPAVIVAGGYFAYATGHGSNLQVISSPDLHTWSPPSDPLPRLPAWASQPWTWAPGVIRRGSTYLMYYTAHHKAWNQQCISVATSASPAGPFTDNSSAPLLCQRSRGGSIDPQPFLAPNGALYLLWKSDNNAIGRPTELWSQQLSPDGRFRIGSPTKLLDALPAPAWHGGIIEGPAMVYAAGAYYLFYGASAWDSPQAGIGYAACTTPLGPCVDQSVTGPWLAGRSGAQGPSGPAVVADPGGGLHLAYHAWTGAVGYPAGNRSLFIDELTFSPGRPILG